MFWKRRREVATRSRSGDKNGVQRAKSKEVGREVNEEEVTMVNSELQTENVREEKKHVKHVGTEDGEKVRRLVRETDIVDTTSTGFGAA